MNENMAFHKETIRRAIDHVVGWHSSEVVTYVEIGVALGKTLRFVADELAARSDSASAMNAHNRPLKAWRAIGIDIPGGWSLSEPAIRANGHSVVHANGFGPRNIDPPVNQSTVYIVGDGPFGQKGGTAFLRQRLVPCVIHLSLIDGCHSKACTIADFLALEPMVAKRGLVMFHDFGVREQGTDIQPHCGEPIGVRVAAEQLGLLGGSRAGFSDDMFADEPGDRRGLGIFKR